MTHRRCIQCEVCSTRTITRTAIGHGEWQEFAFACPGCGVEIRFGMQVDQKRPHFEYTLLRGGAWLDGKELEDTYVRTFDGESLMPLKLPEHVTPFISTVFLPLNGDEFRRSQVGRLHVVKEVWPTIKRLIVHASNQNEALFDRAAQELGYDGGLSGWKDRLRAQLWSFEKYGLFFRPFTMADEQTVRQRINLAESIAGNALPAIVAELDATHSVRDFSAELQRVRDAFARVYPALAPIYNCFYWDENKNSLDDYTLAQKRFEDLKTVYIDAHETFCRISMIAAGLEGLIASGSLCVPTSKRTMQVGEFLGVDNGVKPDLLTNLVVGPLFVPYLNSKLRNGLGHHAAGYDVQTDSISYKNRNRAGVVTVGTLSYIRFCEATVRLYGQIELASLYVSWLQGRVAGLLGRLV